ncbi:MAG: hypothetical protein JW774_05435, partial [Candidatus Aureabacteria bacterium]|nr:hypothetical protein [Candidatus Auribacterota bacterium]
WGQTFVMNRDYRHEEIWKYPILNEYGTALWGLIYITCLDENPSETKERMNDLVLHFNLAQIADGNKRTVVVEGKQHDYFAIKGYWNPVLSMWRPSACGGEREQKMRSLFSDLIEEDTSLEKNIPKTVMLPNPEGSEDPDLKYFSGQPEEIWMQHQISDESRDDSREEYAVTKKFSSPYPLYKGDTLEISYSLTEGKGFALKLQDDAFQADSFRNTLTFKKVLPHGVVRRKVENSLMLTALSFHYGRKLWGDLGCSKNTILEIHSVKVYPLKKKGVMEKKTRQKDRLEQLLYSPRTLDGQNKM